MNDLIQIKKREIAKNPVNTVNARDLWEFLDIKQQFADWIKSQIENLGLEENFDFLVFHKKVEDQK